jgi:uncharacterized protein YndB with AHSA1/START domain
MGYILIIDAGESRQKMATMSNVIIINAPAEKIFSYVNQPSNLPKFWPSLYEIKDEELLPNGGYSYRWTYKMGGIHFTGKGECTDIVPNFLLKSQIYGALNGTMTFSFQSCRNQTRVTLLADYQIPLLILDRLAENIISKINEREAATVLDNLRIVFES